MTERDRRTRDMALFLLSDHTVNETARVYRLSPSWVSRRMREHLPRIDPDLARRMEERLRELQARHQRDAATARWAHARKPLADALRQETSRLLRAQRDGNRAAVREAARRIRALTERIAGGTEDETPAGDRAAPQTDSGVRG